MKEEDLKKIAIQIARKIRFYRGVFFAMRFAFYATALSILVPLTRSYYNIQPLYIIATIISAGTLSGIIYGVSCRVTPLEAAVIVDKKLAFKERLSTALEFMDKKEDLRFVNALLYDTSSKINDINHRNAVHFRFPSEVKFILPVVLIITILLWLPPISINLKGFTPDFEEEKKQQVAEENRGERLSSEKKQKPKTIFEMEINEREIQRKAPRPQGMEGDLKAVFKDTKITQRKPDFTSFLKQGDDRLKLLERTETLPDLKRDFTQTPYQMMMQKMRALSGGSGLEKLSPDKLRQLLEEMERLGKTRRESDEGMEAMQKGQVDKALDSLQKALNRLLAQEKQEKDSKRLEQAKNQENEGQQKDGKQGQNADAEDSSPGTNPSKEVRGVPTPRIPGEKMDAAVEGQTKQGKKDAYDTNLLGKAVKGNSKLRYMNVYSQYKSMVEEAINKENIPYDYRVQVKEYFKSLE